MFQSQGLSCTFSGLPAPHSEGRSRAPPGTDGRASRSRLTAVELLVSAKHMLPK